MTTNHTTDSASDASHANDHAPDRMPLWNRVVNLIFILLPLVGLVGAMTHAWGWGLSWVELVIFFVMYVLTGIGVTVGYHRLFTHRAFETNRAVQAILAVLGAMAVEGSLLRWVAHHRKHHQHSDQPGDPHSPHLHGAGFVNMTRGLWDAHMGWIFRPAARGLHRYIADFKSDRFLRTISALFPLWVALGLLIPAGLAGAITHTWTGVLLGFIWGGLVRIFFVHHVTWSINSVCHIWGTRPFKSTDHSRNNPILGVLAFGEGWHNNHHAFPTSARHGLRWWQLDVSYLIILLMSRVGLAWNVRTPTQSRIAAKLK